MLIRPIQSEDLDDLKELAKTTGGGFTTLPSDVALLEDKINQSLRAFDAKVKKPGGESYLFVLEDAEHSHIVGTSGILSKVGGFEPFYTYKIKTETLCDAELNVNKAIPVLHLSGNHNGPSEVCSLFLRPDYRRGGLGRLLSLSRFLFMAEFPVRFDKNVISELRGVIDENGKSPFWECVGRHFFGTDFYQADYLSGLGKKEFIANLMPKHPVYVPLLPYNVQAIIGKVHRETLPALELLSQEGFVFDNEVDIFDAGPTVTAPLGAIRSVKESHKVEVGDIATVIADPANLILSNARLDFRACVGHLKLLDNGKAQITRETAKDLGVTVGEKIRYVSHHK
jgi:arginine N-succinyltransferase